MRQYVKVKLERVIDELIYDLNHEYDTKKSNANELLQLEIDETIDKLSHLIHSQIQENL